MTVLGLHCHTQAFSSSIELRLLIAVAPLVWSTGSKLSGLVALWHVESSQTRDGTNVSCIGRRTLIHCITREVQ